MTSDDLRRKEEMKSKKHWIAANFKVSGKSQLEENYKHKRMAPSGKLITEIERKVDKSKWIDQRNFNLV